MPFSCVLRNETFLFTTFTFLTIKCHPNRFSVIIVHIADLDLENLLSFIFRMERLYQMENAPILHAKMESSYMSIWNVRIHLCLFVSTTTHQRKSLMSLGVVPNMNANVSQLLCNHVYLLHVIFCDNSSQTC